MLVKITKCAQPEYWYYGRIGEEYEVEWNIEVGQFRTTLPLIDRVHGFIKMKDCEMIK
jgi:hypothetical protein